MNFQDRDPLPPPPLGPLMTWYISLNSWWKRAVSSYCNRLIEKLPMCTTIHEKFSSKNMILTKNIQSAHRCPLRWIWIAFITKSSMHERYLSNLISRRRRVVSLYWKKTWARDMRFPTMWYVRQATAQTSLRIRAVWSEPLLVVWIFFDS